MDITLPDNVLWVLETLEAAGFSAWVVGGAVRDLLLGQPAHDYDIATAARPAQIAAVFPGSNCGLGVRFGTVVVTGKGMTIEVTTFRCEGLYTDFRHPDELRFADCIEDDLSRRDFTINALAYHPQRGLLDVFDGTQDLHAGLIRCVGDPDTRFAEDPLRILRAWRFAAQLGFALDPAACDATVRQAGLLRHISAERIRDEFSKLLLADPRTLMAMPHKVIDQFLPELTTMLDTPQNTPFHQYSVGEHSIVACLQVPADLRVRLATLFHDVGKPRARFHREDGIDHFYSHPAYSAEITREIMGRLKFSGQLTDEVCSLVLQHDRQVGSTDASIRRAVASVSEELFPVLLQLKYADAGSVAEQYREARLASVAEIERRYHELQESEQLVHSTHQLAIDGHDLMTLGVEPGPGMGRLLAKLLDEVIEDPALNTRESLLARAQEILQAQG
ncbi:MAG: HD domain-containing protein [Coriobacteriia bacterium]|nr:HD domain-containing protein [Coriobacteriia bacterium]